MLRFTQADGIIPHGLPHPTRNIFRPPTSPLGAGMQTHRYSRRGIQITDSQSATVSDRTRFLTTPKTFRPRQPRFWGGVADKNSSLRSSRGRTLVITRGRLFYFSFPNFRFQIFPVASPSRHLRCVRLRCRAHVTHRLTPRQASARFRPQPLPDSPPF